MFLSRWIESTGLLDLLAPNCVDKLNGYNDEDTDGRAKIDHEQIKLRRLEAQRQAEEEAEARGFFAKKQRVRYHNKTSDTVCDAVVLGVHFDDGPDYPYYTIKYKKQCEEELEDGSIKVNIVEIEKQTNPDRLTQVPWDSEATWKILQG